MADVDEESLRSANENVQKNNLGDRIKLLSTSPESVIDDALNQVKGERYACRRDSSLFQSHKDLYSRCATRHSLILMKNQRRRKKSHLQR